MTEQQRVRFELWGDKRLPGEKRFSPPYDVPHVIFMPHKKGPMELARDRELTDSQ